MVYTQHRKNDIYTGITAQILLPFLSRCQIPYHPRTHMLYSSSTPSFNTANPATNTSSQPLNTPTALAPFAPLLPSSTQSLHPACMSSTNACPSGLSLPASAIESGSTTGCSQPALLKCGVDAKMLEVPPKVLPLELDGEEEEENVCNSSVFRFLVLIVVHRAFREGAAKYYNHRQSLEQHLSLHSPRPKGVQNPHTVCGLWEVLRSK